MKATYKDYDYYIEFRHDFDPDWEAKSALRNGVALLKHGTMRMDGQVLHRTYNRTTCRILRCQTGFEPKTATLFCMGQGFCSILDIFCKEHGRRGALKNALGGGHAVGVVFPDELGGEHGKYLRKAIWKAYLGRKGPQPTASIPKPDRPFPKTPELHYLSDIKGERKVGPPK